MASSERQRDGLYHGSCHCGKLRFTAMKNDAVPSTVTECNCSYCRRVSTIPNDTGSRSLRKGPTEWHTIHPWDVFCRCRSHNGLVVSNGLCVWFQKDGSSGMETRSVGLMYPTHLHYFSSARSVVAQWPFAIRRARSQPQTWVASSLACTQPLIRRP